MTAPRQLRVQRVDRPHADLLAIGLYGGERLILLLHAGARMTAFGTASERPRGLPADSRVRQLRKQLVGAQLVQVRSGPWGIYVQFEKSEATLGIMTTASLRPDDRFRLTTTGPPEEPSELHAADSLLDASYRSAGEGLLGRLGKDALQDQRVEMERRLRRRRQRLKKRCDAIAGDLARMDAAPSLRADAQMMVANLHQISPGQAALTAVDYTAQPPTTRTLELDVRVGPATQAERLFHRARRLTRGRHVAVERMRQAELELLELDEWTRALADAQTAADLSNLAERLGPETSSPRGKRTEDGQRLPYRRYLASAGRPVLVGRGARDNDALTLQHARPWDLWLHARGVEGAHVIVPLERGEACPPELLVDAATLAAHHSKSRGDQTVEVQYVERRYVRKPRGFPPGAVRVERERVLRLRLEPERLRRLISDHERTRWREQVRGFGGARPSDARCPGTEVPGHRVGPPEEEEPT